jgi:hypothetical protein
MLFPESKSEVTLAAKDEFIHVKHVVKHWFFQKGQNYASQSSHTPRKTLRKSTKPAETKVQLDLDSVCWL